MTSKDELLKRLTDHEDHFIERKTASANSSELRNTLVAFANAVPHGRTAVLYVGVADNGAVLGVPDSDSRQKSIRKLADDCYPPVLFHSEVLEMEGKVVVAVVIEESLAKPHFAGGCYVRKGSETRQASVEEYGKLILSQVDKARFMLQHRSAKWTLRSFGRHIADPQPLEANMSAEAECVLEDCNAFYARFQQVGTGQLISIEMHAISPMWDEKEHRPMAIIRPIRFAGGA